MSDSSDLLARNYDTKFYDGEDRLNFVRKVYSILGVQILITALITLIPMTNEKAAIWMHDNWGLLLACCIGTIVISCAMVCFIQLTRQVPINYILLLLFTVLEAYLVASVAAVSDKEVVLAAAFTTAAIVVGISIFAWTVKVDFTILGPIVLILALSMSMVAIFAFAFHFKGLHMVYCGIGVILFGFYLLFDT